MRNALTALALAALLTPAVRAQMAPHHHPPTPSPAAGPQEPPGPSHDPGAHGGHDLGPAGATYDLRWLDGMVQHHTGAMRMGEFVFDIGSPGVGSLAKEIWRDQAQEIKAMGQWRRAWYPEAPVAPVTLRRGGNPDALADLVPMDGDQRAALRMVGNAPTRRNRVTWFLEGMLAHHGGALLMAHDALAKSSNPTLLRMARAIIVAQRREIIQLRKMLQHDGLNKPEYGRFDRLFSLRAVE
jgi:uncharacterized protein (DUF305 family)